MPPLEDMFHPPMITAELPGVGGKIKTIPEDFEVEEIPAYEPSGQGDFLYLWIEKRDMGAEYFVRQIYRTNFFLFRINDVNGRHSSTLLRLPHNQQPILTTGHCSADKQQVFIWTSVNHLQTLYSYALIPHMPSIVLFLLSFVFIKNMFVNPVKTLLGEF